MDKKFTTETILAKSFQSFRLHFAYFSILTLIFLALILLTSFALAPLLLTSQLTIFLYVLLLVAIYARLAVMVHRAVLMNDKSVAKFFSWSIHDTKFLIWAMTISITFMAFLFLVIFPFAKSGNPGVFTVIMLVVIIGLGLVFSKICLIFPSIAVGHNISLKQAWETSKGHVGSLFFLVIVLPYIINKLLSKIPETDLVIEIILMLVNVLIVIFEVTLLSHCYEALFKQDKSNPSEDEIQA
jgi:hypothetical protein